MLITPPVGGIFYIRIFSQINLLALIMDNASYQKCALVREYAEAHGIRLRFLPTYSLNLNLIERYWKLVKLEVLNAAYHGTFGEFKETIDRCISDPEGKHAKKVASLITDNFQLFTDVLYRPHDISMPKGV
jgi:transposase